MKLHHKGFMLVLLEKMQLAWDDVLVDLALQEYMLTGRYWNNHFRIILEELAAAGLITREAHHLDSKTDRLVFQYAISNFGRERMRDTGLL